MRAAGRPANASRTLGGYLTSFGPLDQRRVAADNTSRMLVLPCASFGPLDRSCYEINGFFWFATVGVAICRPQRWAWYALRFVGKAQNIGTFRAANGRPYSGIWIAARSERCTPQSATLTAPLTGSLWHPRQYSCILHPGGKQARERHTQTHKLFH